MKVEDKGTTTAVARTTREEGGWYTAASNCSQGVWRGVRMSQAPTMTTGTTGTMTTGQWGQWERENGNGDGNGAMMGQWADRDTMMGHQGSGRFFASFE